MGSELNRRRLYILLQDLGTRLWGLEGRCQLGERHHGGKLITHSPGNIAVLPFAVTLSQQRIIAATPLWVAAEKIKRKNGFMHWVVVAHIRRKTNKNRKAYLKELELNNIIFKLLNSHLGKWDPLSFILLISEQSWTLLELPHCQKVHANGHFPFDMCRHISKMH